MAPFRFAGHRRYKILQRLDGVLQVRESKYIMLHAPRAALTEITDLLPGTEHPTVIPLDGSDDNIRTLIYYADGRISYDWQHEGAVLLGGR